MEILDGKYTSSVMLQNLKTEIQKYLQEGKRAPRIDIMLVGDDYASQMYVNMKEKKALDLGILVNIHTFDKDISQAQLIKLIKSLIMRMKLMELWYNYQCLSILTKVKY